MPNTYFRFKRFTIHQDRCAMKVTTDACLFGAWAAGTVGSQQSAVSSQQSAVSKMLEIGTGTGLLALMIAQKTIGSIDTIEIDKDAFEQATENISRSPWKDRIHSYHVDARSFQPSSAYDVIISNPPFYENELKSPDEKKNLAHHGGLILSGLFEIVSKNLDSSGQFYLMLPAKRMKEFFSVLPKFGLQVSESVLVKQSAKHEPFRFLVKGEHQSKGNTSCPTIEIAIRNDQQEYTSEFVELLKDYYLSL
jgi:tRNA1Val (adenine37-N6)-methyltransferase